MYTMSFVRKIKRGGAVYLAEVENIREGGKVIQKHIRYVGKEVNGKTVKKVNSSDIKIKEVKRSLDVLAIKQIADGLKISDIENKHFLSLIYSQLLENRSLNKLENWIRFTEIPEVIGLKQISTKELYESLSEMTKEDFQRLNSEMNTIFQQYETDKKTAVIDVTDTYFEGTKQNIKRRRGKDGKVKQLLQIGLAVSFNNGFPLFFKKYQGNLSNIQIFKDMTLEIKNKGLTAVIVDRGMISPENMKMILSLDMTMIAGLKKTTTLCAESISKIKRDEIYSAPNMIELKNTTVFAQTFDYFGGKLIVVYNPALEVVKKDLRLRRGEDITKDMGFSLIFHNTQNETKEVVKKYYDKEIIERAFKQMKGVLNLRPIRVWLEGHVNGHILICYMAYAILALMNYKLKKLGVSAVSALDSLKYGYRVRLEDKTNKHEWDLFVPLEPNQKNILKALGVVYKN